jgi:mono/diheme cytochrome c family protein
MRLRFFVAAVVAFIIILVSCSESTSPGAPVDVQAVYVKRCATCHGSEGNLEMGGAKKIVDCKLSKQEIKNQILYGKGKMPPFQEILTGAEVDALTDYAFKLSGR